MTDDLPFGHPAQDPSDDAQSRVLARVNATVRQRKARRRVLTALPVIAAIALVAVAVVNTRNSDSDKDEQVVSASPGDVVQHCEPGEDVVAFTQSEGAMVEGSSVVSVAGAGSRKVRNVTGDWVATDPSFSPDGRTLAVTRANGDLDSGGPYATSVWLVGVNGEHPRPLTDGPHDTSPTWSPDGRTIAFVRWDDAGLGSIASIPSEGGEVTTILADQRVRLLAWSSDDERLAFVVEEYDESNPEVVARSVWTVQSDGTGRQKVVTVADFHPIQLFWEPSGDAVWLTGSDGPRVALSRVNLADGDVQEIGRDVYRANWSQDGRRLYVILGSEDEADYTLNVAQVVDGRLEVGRDLGTAWDGFPYSYYSVDVGPCLPDGLPPMDTDLGPDLPLEGTRWRDGAVVVQFEPVDGACDGLPCRQRLSTDVGWNGLPVTIDVMVSADTITTISSEMPPEYANYCTGVTAYFPIDAPTRYRIEGDQLHLASEDCADLMLVAESDG